MRLKLGAYNLITATGEVVCFPVQLGTANCQGFTRKVKCFYSIIFVAWRPMGIGLLAGS